MLERIINQTDMLSQLSPEELDDIEVGLADHEKTNGGSGNTYARVWGQSPEEMLQLIEDITQSETELVHGMQTVLPQIEKQSLE